jgi:hypothetical protein
MAAVALLVNRWFLIVKEAKCLRCKKTLACSKEIPNQVWNDEVFLCRLNFISSRKINNLTSDNKSSQV